MPDFSILLPHLHTATDIRALQVALSTIVRHTSHDYELMIQAHHGDSAYPIWNTLARAATTDWLIFTVSDHFVSPGWDIPLWEARDENVLVTGGLVESGYCAVAEQCLEQNFGRSPETFDEAAFNTFAAAKPALPTIEGWVWPWIIHRQTFLAMGGFGEDPVVSDLHFFQQWQASGRTWRRVQSYSYHLMKWSFTGENR